MALRSAGRDVVPESECGGPALRDQHRAMTLVVSWPAIAVGEASVVVERACGYGCSREVRIYLGKSNGTWQVLRSELDWAS
jgi:hypothetical protein